MLLANLTKREYVDLRKVNDYLFQTIFFALLWGGDFDHPQFGRWAGDQVVVITDPDIIYAKAIRMIGDGKLNLPTSILEELQGPWWNSPPLSSLALRKFKDITKEVVDSLCPSDPEEGFAFQMFFNLILERRKMMRYWV